MKMQVLLILIMLAGNSFSQEKKLPEGFVYVKDNIPDVALDIRYASSNNFIGKPVEAYKKPVAILSKPAAEALKKVQEELTHEGYFLKIFDAYRPQTAVNDFIIWAKDPADTIAKKDFYPNVDKKDLFKLGYIASKSGHSRGSTVDLTIVNAATGEELDMGSTYDYFGEISHHSSTKITAGQKANRELLKNVMIKHGFRPYPEEWWHYSLKKEPYPNTFFDFPVE